jgi:hypothetical protein
MASTIVIPDPNEIARRLERLDHLGVPEAIRPAIAVRQRPKFQTLLPLAIVLGAIATAIGALVLWSSQLHSIAAHDAEAAGALLYDSDFGPGEVALIFAVLFLAGWLLALLFGKFGVEAARDRWAHDMIVQPAKYRAAVDAVWRFTIARHGRSGSNAEAFLDQLASGLTRDLAFAACAVIMLATILTLAFPAHVAFATRDLIADRPIISAFGAGTTHKLASAASLTTGCANFAKQGEVLRFHVDFVDGASVELGGWTPVASVTAAQISALEILAARMPPGIPKARWRDIAGRSQLQAACIREKAQTAGADGIARLERLLHINKEERAALGSGF